MEKPFSTEFSLTLEIAQAGPMYLVSVKYGKEWLKGCSLDLPAAIKIAMDKLTVIVTRDIKSIV